MGFTRNDFENMVRNFDTTNCGSIDYRDFATSCVLLNSPLPTAEDIEALKKAVQQPEVAKDAFVRAACWFDATESSKDREYSHDFARAEHIKAILFDLHAGDAASAQVSAFTASLLLSDLRKGKTGLKAYSDIICFQGPSKQK